MRRIAAMSITHVGAVFTGAELLGAGMDYTSIWDRHGGSVREHPVTSEGSVSTLETVDVSFGESSDASNVIDIGKLETLG